MTLLRTTAAQKKFLYYSLLLGTLKLLNYDLLFTNIYNLIYFMYTFTMVSPLSSMMRFFPKKFFMRFFGGNFWGGVVVHGVVTIKPSQDRQSFINAFCNKSNIANRFTDCVRISALARTMEGFILGLSIKKKVSKVASSSLSLMLTLIWGTRVSQMQSTGGEGGNLGKMVKTVGGHGGTTQVFCKWGDRH